MNEKTNNTNSVLLSDKELDQVSGGMKIFLIKNPKIISPLLRIIFNIKSKRKK